MAGYGEAHAGGTHRAHGKHPGGPISIGWTVLAAAIIGAGMFLIFYWLYTFNLEWSWGIGLVLIGALMLFSPRAGADSA